MEEKKKERNKLPENFQTIDELSEFWDTHSTADYEEFMEPVEMDIKLNSKRIYCSIAFDVLREIRNHAHRQGVSVETIVNVWLQEKISSLKE